MAGVLPLLKKGAFPSLIDTDTANKLVSLANALATMKVNPSGYGKIVVGEKDAVLDLSPLQKSIEDLSKKLDAINKTTASGAAIDLPALSKRVDGILQSIANGTIAATCNTDGTIKVTITFANLPGPSE